MNIWEAHDVIYHYTTQAGLYGIVENHTLHATHFKYLNDATEMSQIITKLKEAVAPTVRQLYESLADKNQEAARQMAEQGGLDALAQHDTNALIDVLHNVTFGVDRQHRFFQPFVTSFCSHKMSYEMENGLLRAPRKIAPGQRLANQIR